jgi:MFS family permease
LSKPRLWTKEFISISLASFFIFIIFYMLMVTLPVYVTDELNGNGQDIGLITIGFVVAAIIFRPFSGNWLNTLGQKKTLLLGGIIFCIGSFLYFNVSSIFVLFMIRIFHGIGFGIATTATGGIVATVIPNERRGEGMGYYSTFMNLAMVIGPFLGLTIIHSFGYSILFTISVVFSIFTIVCSLWLKAPQMIKKIEENATKPRFSFSHYFEKKALPIAFVAFTLSFVYSGVLSFISVYAGKLNLVEASSFFFVVYATFLLISRPFTGKWFDLYGANKIIYPCILIFAAGIYLLSQVSSAWMLLLAGGLIGLGFGTLLSSFQSIAIQTTAPKRAGIATATFLVLFDSGFALGSYILGIMTTYYSYEKIYLVCSLMVVLTIGLYYVLHAKKAILKNRLC